MKNIVRTVLCFGLFFILSIGKIRAIEPLYQVQIDKEIKIIPTATTTEVKTTETEKISIEPKTEEIKEETKVVEKEVEEIKSKNSDKLFWVIIVGLLVLILAIQVWSTKRDEERQIKK